MKKKNNKGYIGIDISISLLIIIILMPIIIAITNNINVANARISRKAQAISIATNVMECVKSILAEDDSDILVDDIYETITATTRGIAAANIKTAISFVLILSLKVTFSPETPVFSAINKTSKKNLLKYIHALIILYINEMPIKSR